MHPSDRSTKERILAAAIESLEREGWDAVTVRGIAASAGVNLALVNYHFGSMTNLKLTALEAALQDMVAMPADGGPDGADVQGWLPDLIGLALSSDPAGGRKRIFESALAAALHDRDLAIRMRPMLDRSRAQLTGRIEEAVAAGRLPARTDPPALAIALLAMLDGLWLQRAIDPGIEADRVARTVIAMLVGPVAS